MLINREVTVSTYLTTNINRNQATSVNMKILLAELIVIVYLTASENSYKFISEI
jgi:hypothetical protein